MWFFVVMVPGLLRFVGWYNIILWVLVTGAGFCGFDGCEYLRLVDFIAMVGCRWVVFWVGSVCWLVGCWLRVCLGCCEACFVGLMFGVCMMCFVVSVAGCELVNCGLIVCWWCGFGVFGLWFRRPLGLMVGLCVVLWCLWGVVMVVDCCVSWGWCDTHFRACE